jgi:hypothetical protein
MNILYQQRHSVYVDSDWSSPGYEHTTEVAVFDDHEALVEQIREAVYIPTPYEWNWLGEECRVEDHAAEGCMWYGLLLDGPIHKVISAYNSMDRAGILFDAWVQFTEAKRIDFKHAHDNVDDFEKDALSESLNILMEHSKKYDYIEYDDCPNFYEVQKAARIFLPAMKSYWNTYMVELMKKRTPRSFEFTVDSDHRDSYTYHAFTRIYDNAIWNAITEDRQINETVLDRLNRESLEYYESEEGQAEAKAEQERHNEMMTYMGESGLNSYSIDDEGRYHMWRE